MTKKFAIVLITAALLGCVTTRQQERDLKKWESEEVLQEETSVTAAMLLGLLPGGGSFYTGQVGFGILDLLFWPASICWDPFVGRDGAKQDNWNATDSYVRGLEAQRKRAFARLEEMHQTRQISDAEYQRLNVEIEVAPLKTFAGNYSFEKLIGRRQPASIRK